MAWENATVFTEFILLGLSSNQKTQMILFCIFLICYLIILIGNSVIIIVTLAENSLQTPMYFFLTNLSFLDICYSSSVVPRMLKDMLSAQKKISYAECVAQMYLSLSLGETECILLAIMAYDRYVAICYPLHYTSIMNKSVCIKMSVATWMCGFQLSILHVVLTWDTSLCGPNVINHFMCEVPEILALSCRSVALNEFVIFVIGVIVLMIPITIIIMSYVNIIFAILKITLSTKQIKAFSTCGSHVVVVTLFYGSAMATYMKPRSQSTPCTDKMFAIFYTIATPMLNPLIYTLRNKEVKKAVKVRIQNIFLTT
ncbi:putative olfactory receptor 2B8 [Spea bombifrons]|uniref:putative olfactory receptor 2B8 n=1 Tax=Spea bombifrons TaxID=233779 RepID=UPI0023496070|nr:putative olfactory receptor 2B8 [Spea bombifrons]